MAHQEQVSVSVQSIIIQVCSHEVQSVRASALLAGWAILRVVVWAGASKVAMTGTSLAGQWLRLRAASAGGARSIPGQGTKIPQAVWRG